MMIMKYKIYTLMIFILIVSPVYASFNCLNDTTSQFSMALDIDGSTTNIEFNNTCAGSCDNYTGKCTSLDYVDTQTPIIVLLLIAVIFTMLYIVHTTSGKQKKSHKKVMGHG